MSQLDVVTHITKTCSGQRADLELLERMRARYLKIASDASGSPETMTAVSQQSLVQTGSSNSDWEARASQGINKKGLSLDREWSEKTWINKSNRNEKLKLLKDDGFDIMPLQGPEIGSEDITQAILAHVAARKQNSSQGRPQVTVDNRTDSTGEVEEAVETSKPSPDEDFAHHSCPFSITPLKRKRSTSCDTSAELLYSHLYTDNDERAHKRQCILDIRKTSHMEATTEETAPTWYRLKTTVLSDIFRPAAPWPSSKKAISRLTIAFPSQTANVDVPGTLDLASKGYDNTMKELRALAGDADNNGTFQIPSPFPFDGQRGIKVTTNVPLRTVIEGDLKVLIGLMKRLATPGKGLAFIAKKCFNEEGKRVEENELFELSNATQRQLREIGEELKLGVKNGHAQVQVLWVA
jgi:hypothetical protein